jgi:hypothetical protein
MYSESASPQLARIISQSAWLLNFKWPYQARFMNMFEMVRRMIAFISGELPIIAEPHLAV